MAGLSTLGLSPDQALAQMNRLIDQQSFMLAANAGRPFGANLAPPKPQGPQAGGVK